MKYIIDVPEDRIHDGVLCAMGIMEDSLDHYLPTGIKATPYDESEAGKRGQEEAWEFAKKILAPSDNSDALTVEDLADCYGTDDAYDVVCGTTFAEASEKYEAWKKQKDGIHVGDEIYDRRVKGVVTHVDNSKAGVFYPVVAQSGATYVLSGLEAKKTGRTFPEVEELLNKLREPS